MKHNKQEIIEKGILLFRENGYHATGISKILDECSISKGTFYNYFSSKEDFARATIISYSLQMQKLIDTYMNFKSMPADKRIKRYFEQVIRLNKKDGAKNGCLLMNFMVETAGTDIHFASLTQREFQTWILLLAPTIETAQKNKEITNKIPARQIAELIYLQLYGEFANMKSVRSTVKMESRLNIIFELIKHNH